MTDAAPPRVMGLNPFEPGFFDDPYAQYAAVQEADPIHLTPLGTWLITRWDDVHTLLRTPGTSVEERKITGGPRRTDALAEIRLARGLERQRSLAILNIDPPDHTRIRRLMSKAFTPEPWSGSATVPASSWRGSSTTSPNVETNRSTSSASSPSRCRSG
jgi:cytochrome P450